MEQQVISKERVVDHGEVYTRAREVNAMLDLVKQETERIESRFLEPACGTDNFLAEILKRKLRIVEVRYAKSQLEFERNGVLAVSSLYGIDILEDNVVKCRKRLFDIFEQIYKRFYRVAAKEECGEAVKFILGRNIICGDSLSLKTVGDNPQPIIFSEWSPVNGSMLKRRDYTFHALFESERFMVAPPKSDLGDNVFIPKPEKEYRLCHFLKVKDAQE